MYKCPICSLSLAVQGGSWKCSANHSFDIAKEGYVNLLPVNKKRSKEPGDSKSMLQSRRHFLNQGFYEPLAKSLFNTLSDDLPDSSRVLDMGCGEGYYLDYLLSGVEQIQVSQFAALDISKFAVQMTAKRVRHSSHNVECSVASAVDTPYQGDCFDRIYNIFAPYSALEVCRILKPQGRFILVGPGVSHLNELSAVIYDEVQPHEGNTKAVLQYPQLRQVSSETIKTRVAITGKLLPDLLAMTPYYWSTSESQKQKLFAKDALKVTLHFELKVFTKESII